ncbi:hypothetical protein FSP39_009960 [Pinctada imbricata]|uniref:Uncharacterized protein n=1 Tax=Pinctada imbricata TaxID=66713 RepID=A0AA88Y361_PINIB|nr:hypothetical protein FSP39_009960 [Pinctada imbricata]
MQYMRMPDLTESQEAAGASSGGRSENNVINTTVNGHHSSGDEADKEDNPVLPSIPDSFLQKLGLSANQDEEISPDQLTDQEIENKFTSLALAFKTDKITLDKRLEIQERSRDIAEENVAKEISGIRDAWDKLNQIILDTQVREVLLKIQKHLDVLEQVTSRLSGRAEVYGAVQQERRMSKAIEVMLSHVENLRMVHEREHNELEEARKMIQDSRPFGGSSSLELGEYGIKGRSLSVCQASALQPRGPRRRVSEVVIPRGPGGATLSHSASIDPKSKFQHIVASTAMKNSIGNTMRRASMEKQASTSSLGSLQSQSRENSMESKNGLPVTQRVLSQNNSEEDAYQKGFEQGIKAQIGGKLASLREQQNSISEKLEEIQDKCDEDDNIPSIDFKEMIVRKFWEVVPEWETASKKLRLTMAGFVFFMALCSIFLSFIPLGQATMQVYPHYKHMDKPPF